MKKNIPLLLLLFATLFSFSQESFEKIIDDGDVNEFAAELVQTADSGYLLCGGKEGKALLMKTDRYGTVQWSQTYDEGFGSNVSSLYLTADNGVILAGTTGDSEGFSLVYLVKTNATGTKEWSKSFEINGSDRANDVVQTNDGGYLIVGEADFGGFVLRVNASGDFVWQQVYQESMYHWQFYQVDKTTDNNYIIVGSENSTGTSGYSVNLIKMNDSGGEVWNKTYSAGYGYSVKQTGDGGFIATGSGFENDLYVVKTDALGNEQWHEDYFVSYNSSTGYGISETIDGGYAILFTAENYDPPVGGYGILKINSTGAEQWNRYYSGLMDPWVGHIIETSDYGLAMCGFFNWYDEFFSVEDKDVYLLKTNSDGTGCFLYTYQNKDICMVTVDGATGKNKIIWTQESGVPASAYNIYKMTTEDWTVIGTVNSYELSEYIDMTSNPGTASDKYKISIIDTCGTEIAPGDYHKTIHLNVSPATPTGFALTWEHYEGFDYTKYRIFRGTTPTEMVQIDSTNSTNFTYTDETSLTGALYYRVAAVKPVPCYSSTAGSKEVGGPFSQSVSNLEDNGVGGNVDEISGKFALDIYPNPVDQTTKIKYVLNSQEQVEIQLFNINGQKIHILLNQKQAPGSHSILLNSQELKLNSGVYLLKCRFGNEIINREIVVL